VTVRWLLWGGLLTFNLGDCGVWVAENGQFQTLWGCSAAGLNQIGVMIGCCPFRAGLSLAVFGLNSLKTLGKRRILWFFEEGKWAAIPLASLKK